MSDGDYNSITEDGSILYRGFTITVSTIQCHIWDGDKFIQTAHGEPGLALSRAKIICDAIRKPPSETVCVRQEGCSAPRHFLDCPVWSFNQKGSLR